MPRHVSLPCDELCAAYAAGQSTTALARRYGCSPTTVAKNLRGCGAALRVSRYAAVPIDEAALRRAYLDERRPIAAIAAQFGVCASTIGNKRRQYGIAARGRSAAPAQGA
jgi:transposase-like protein